MSYTLHPRSRKRRIGFSRIDRLKVSSAIVTILFFVVIGATLGTGFLFAWYSRDLPRPDKVQRTEGFSTTIFDRNSEPLYDIFGDQNRVPLEFADMPESIRQATIAIEDKDFYKHKGFSERGMLRALLNIVFLGHLQGGSTLTQQLVKNVLLTQVRSLPRKIKEFILSVQIERKYSKDEILQMYLNETPYGGPTAGIEAASKYYFDKHAKDLTLTESVILAGFPQGPSRYSPYNAQDPKAYIWRAQQVARRMREDGYISKFQEDQVNKEIPQVQFVAKRQDIKAPHFVMYVREQLNNQFGEKMVETGGLHVTTTLDWKTQQQAEKILSEELDKLKGLKVGNGAAIVLNPKTGEILSMVGSKDYFATPSGAFNVVVQGTRQPGSSIKPIIYAAALKRNYTSATLLFDVETHFPGGAGKEDYIPKNYDGKFRGPLQLRFALGNSINTVAVKTLGLVGIKDALKLASDMGLTTLTPTDDMVKKVGLSLVLGGGDVRLIDLTQAFGVFATGGYRHEPYAIAKVTDNKGKILFEQKNTRGNRVLSEDVSFLISHILLDNTARKETFGERSYLVIPGKTVAVKTGTTDDLHDNWTIGFTPSVVTGVWVGNNDNTPMNPRLVSGVTGAAPIWNRIMTAALKEKGDEQFSVPSGVVSVEIDSLTGGLARAGQPTRSEYFIKGTEPTDQSPFYKKIKVSKSHSDQLANDVEQATGNFEEKEFLVFHEDDPISTDGKNRWQEGIDSWVSKQTDSKYHPPTQTSSDRSNQIVVSILTPGDQNRVDDNQVRVEAKAVGVNSINKLELEIDGLVRLSTNDNKLSEVVNLANGAHQLKVRAFDSKGNSGDSVVRIGVKVPWDQAANPTSVPSPTQ